MFKLRRFALVLVVSLAASAGACQKGRDGVASGGSSKLRLALAHGRNRETGGLERLLEARLPGTDVEITTPAYDAVAKVMRNGEAEAAVVEPLAATLAVEQGSAAVALAEVREVMIEERSDERTSYYSYWIVREDSPYQYLRDLRGKRVAFAERSSAAGYVFPLARLVDLGLIEKQEGQPAYAPSFFGDAVFAGDYERAYELLKQGQVDAMVLAGDAPEATYREAFDTSRVLEQQGPVPTGVVLFSRSLSEPLRSRFRNALLELGSPEQQDEARRAFDDRFVRFEEADDAHLSGLRRALDSAGLSGARAGD